MKKCILFYVSVILVLALMSASAQAVMTHQYTFIKGTVAGWNGWEDHGVVGGAPGTAGGAAYVNGGYLNCDNNGDFMSMSGPTINIPSYSELTLELWTAQPTWDQGYSMTASFGDSNTASWGYGMNYVAISTARGDNVSRSMMTRGDFNPGYQTEVGENGPEILDGLQHQYVLTVGPLDCCFDQDVITLYIDGVLQGAHIIEDRTLGALSNALAYLGKGLYTGDATTISTIDELRIYDEALGCDAVMARYIEGPVPVPEPATMVLLGLGSLALLRRRKS